MMINGSKNRLAYHVIPSLLSVNQMKIGSEVSKLLKAGASWLHIDVMDGNFVPNLAFGPQIVQDLSTSFPPSVLYKDVHLMTQAPSKHLDAFIKAGASQCTFHIEAVDSPIDEISYLGAHGIDAGIAISPSTPIDDDLMALLRHNLPLINTVLVMTVEPGFGGQSFLPETLQKVQKLRRAFSNLNIQVDGGITSVTINDAVKAGANLFVAGSAVFNHPKNLSPAASFQQLQASVTNVANDDDEP